MKPRAIQVRKSWTFDQACAAQERFRASGGAFVDPASPFDQWIALSKLDELKEGYECGNAYSLMQAIRQCANHDLVMPEWVRKAYIDAFDKVHNYRAKSWDEVFGKPLAKGANLSALRKKQIYAVQVWVAVQDQHARGTTIDDELFTQIGRTLGLGLTLTKDYYGWWKKTYGNRSSAKKKKTTPRTLKK